MTITQLRYILAVAEHQNFTKAASILSVTQPTLSMQIHKLEEELSIAIFDRRKKPIALTAVGRQIADQAHKIVEETERIKVLVDQQKGFVGGRLKLGIIPTVMGTLLPLFLNDFVRKYPKVELAVKEKKPEELLEAVERGHLDAGITATPLRRERLKKRVLYYEPILAYVPKNHYLASREKLRPGDIKMEEVLMLQKGYGFRENVRNLCSPTKSDKQETFPWESSTFDTLIKLCDKGFGMTLLPYLQSLELGEKEGAAVREFEKPFPAREISLVCGTNESKIHILAALQESIQKAVKNIMVFQEVNICSPLSKQ